MTFNTSALDPVPSAPVAAQATSAPHEHAWLVESRHPTSLGTVLYVRCADCGTRRMDVQTLGTAAPAAASTEIAPGQP